MCSIDIDGEDYKVFLEKIPGDSIGYFVHSYVNGKEVSDQTYKTINNYQDAKENALELIEVSIRSELKRQNEL